MRCPLRVHSSQIVSLALRGTMMHERGKSKSYAYRGVTHASNLINRASTDGGSRQSPTNGGRGGLMADGRAPKDGGACDCAMAQCDIGQYCEAKINVGMTMSKFQNYEVQDSLGLLPQSLWINLWSLLKSKGGPNRCIGRSLVDQKHRDFCFQNASPQLAELTVSSGITSVLRHFLPQ